MKVYTHFFEKIICLENLFSAWCEFRRGKRKRLDVQEFERYLEDNIFRLHEQLKNGTYVHGSYHAFKIFDPKFREIHKATVRDRIVHHAIYRILYPIFDETFISDSYSCRLEKVTHRAVVRLANFTRKVSRNHKGQCFILKCDVKKFFASVDHDILLNLIKKRIKDDRVMWLAKQVIRSFSASPRFQRERERELKEDFQEIGLPLGNLTSQLFANIYLNELDQFVKHELKIEFYLRYTDDFVAVAEDRDTLGSLINPINKFLQTRLKTSLHPHKVEIRKLRQGVDFLGYIILPHHIVLRTKTKQRMFKRIKLNKQKLDVGLMSEESFNQSLQSYLGILKHCNGYKIKQQLPETIKERQN